MDRAFKSLAKMQNLLNLADAQYIKIHTNSLLITHEKIKAFVDRMHNWMDLTDTATPRDRAGFSIKRRISSSVMFYIRSNHLLMKAGPLCLVKCALAASIHGFGNNSNRSRSYHAPRQSDFVPSPCAQKASVVSAALWIREVLSPELDCLFGEDVFCTHAEVEECLENLLREGVLTKCISPTVSGLTRGASSTISSSIASTNQGSRRSVDRVVDK